MNAKTYYRLIGCILGLVSFAHLVRAVSGASLVVAGWSVPLWLSWVAFLVAGFLSYTGFRLASK